MGEQWLIPGSQLLFSLKATKLNFSQYTSTRIQLVARTLKISKEIELLLLGIGISQALHLGMNAIFARVKDSKNFLLGFFFLSIGIRIAKSFIWVYWEVTPDWLINLGFTAHLVAGPLLMLYTLQFVFGKKWSQWSFLHFLPSIASLFFVSRLTLDHFWYLGGYSLLLFQQMAYGMATLIILISGTNGSNEHKGFFWKINSGSGSQVWWLACYFFKPPISPTIFWD